MAKTVEQIASDLNLSVTTVRLVLNGKAEQYRISVKTQTRINEYVERYGYVIMKYIEELSDGMMQMGPGTLYTLLKKLTKLQWIQQLTSDSRTKTYLITQEGKRILCQEVKRRERMVEDANKALKKGIV